MPGFVAVPDAATVRLAMLLDEVPVECGFNFVKAGFDQAGLDALTASVGNHWADNMMPLLNQGCIYQGAGGTGLRSFDDVFTFIVAEPPVLGGGTGLMLPNQNAFVVTLETGRRGKGNTGRIYVPGLGAGNMDGSNTVDAAWASDVVDAITGIRIAANGLGWALVVVHRQRNNVTLNPRDYTTIIDEDYKDLLVDSMDSRKPNP